MSEYPFLPLSVDAYFRDTRHLSAAQHGAYLLLLMEAWQRPNSSLPDDEVILARLACMSAPEWEQNRDVILAFWKHDGRTKTYTQKRLSETKDHVKKNSANQSSKAKSRWKKEKDTSRGNAADHAAGDAAPMPQGMPQESRNDASQSQSQSQESSASPTPSSPAQGGADDLFDFVEQTIRSIPGIDKHPVATQPSIAAIWSMVKDGWDLKTEVVPGIRMCLARAKSPIRSWSYFVDHITEQRTSTPKPPVEEVSEKVWRDRLTFARANRTWDRKNWGPFPNQPGCLTPAKLVETDDGHGWVEWGERRTA